MGHIHFMEPLMISLEYRYVQEPEKNYRKTVRNVQETFTTETERVYRRAGVRNFSPVGHRLVQ